MIALVFSLAFAQTEFEDGAIPQINAQHFRPTTDGHRTLWADDAQRGPHNRFFARALVHYTQAPLVYVVEGEEQRMVGSIGQTDLLANYAYDRLRIGVAVPIHMFQESDFADSQVGLGDIAPDLKLTLLDGDAPLDLALSGRINLPTSTMELALGVPTVGYEIAGIVSKDVGPVLLSANVGTKGGPNVVLDGDSYNDFFTFRTALNYAVSDRFGLGPEVVGSVDYATPTVAGSSPLEWLLSGYGRASEDIVVRAGAGTGLTVGIGSPEFRAMLGIGYEPGELAPKDADGDGLVDKEDECPEDPEDRDDFEDTDGCPDLDNDKDGILDAADACMNVPEDKDTYKDNDGCPDPETLVTVQVVDENKQPLDLAKMILRCGDDFEKRARSEVEVELQPGECTVVGNAGSYEKQTMTFNVESGAPMTVMVALKRQKEVKVVVSRDRIDLKDKVYFETAKATIKSQSFGLLDQAVQILVDYPEIKKLRVEGHTDARGSASYNLKLSKQRAASVMQYFIDKGIDAERLTSQGYGEERPLDTANNEAAWTKNRRVDFFIESWVDTE